MLNPIDSRKAFGYFGFMLGFMPLSTVTLRAVLMDNVQTSGEAFFALLFLGAALLTAAVGYAFGKSVPAMIERVRKYRQPNRLALLSVIGLVWGLVAGTAGGLLLFIIGAIFGGIIGATVGAVTVPVFATLHDLLRRGDLIEVRHFVPVAFGITLSLCAFLLGVG